MDIYGRWDWRILAVLIIGGFIAGWSSAIASRSEESPNELAGHPRRSG